MSTITLQHDPSTLLNSKTILLDTNVFVEGYSYPTEFAVLIGDLINAGAAFTTIEAVRLEFISKNRTKQELAKKIDFYTKILTHPELPTSTFEKQFQEYSLIFAFGKQAQTFKTVDFMLAAAMKRYVSNVFLLTNDHHDFTPQLFNLEALLPLTPTQGCIVPFALYSFSEEKYAALISDHSK